MTKTALVTGGAKRLGRAMVEELGAMGYSVVVHYASSEDDAQELVAMLREKGVEAACLQADLLDEAQCATLIKHASELINQPLSVLINNASIFEYDTIETATLQSWDRHIGSNLKAPFLLTQAFAKQVPKTCQDENGETIAAGNVINMIDQRVRKLTPEFMTYTIAKFGLWGFTQTAAQALAPNIRVNGIAPGPTLKGVRQSEDHFKRQRENTILKRGSSAGEICRTMRFILESPSLTGQVIFSDGGQHLGWQTPDILGTE